mmetsp:Transcript_15107/g.24811  ORF Transcript_15107/g.24811 Transcript_15107/m.24811 type:complete len:136 (-) Transcript_15107:275-682(-)
MHVILQYICIKSFTIRQKLQQSNKNGTNNLNYCHNEYGILMYVRFCDIGGMPTHTLSPIVSSFYLLPNSTYLSCVLSQRKNAIVLTTTTSFKSMLFNERQPQNVFFCPVFIVNINQFPINEIGTIETYMPRHQSQ